MMIKATERMHSRSSMVQIGMSCMGQQLVAAYRTMKDLETGKQFCMMMYWNGSNKSVTFAVHDSDEYMHLFFEDVDADREREAYLCEHGGIELSASVTESKEYKRVYEQLLRAVRKSMEELGYEIGDDLMVKR